LNLYDHLSSVLSNLLDERPENAADTFEEVSRQIKADQYVESTTMKSEGDPSSQVALAQTQEKLFKKAEGDEAPEEPEDDEAEPVIDNVIEQMNYFEDAGIGLGREESFRLFLSLQQLRTQASFQKIRFWGKIFGTKQNYYVAECTFTKGEEPQAPEAEEPEAGEPAADDAEGEGDGDGIELPKSEWKPPKPLATEEYGAGANKHMYYVCSEPGMPWERLANVTPAQIQVARKIKKVFTGDLDTPIDSYPPFEGTEGNYLRAQIAQICADTVISPMGFYTFDEEDDEEEEKTEYIKDGEFEGMPREKLMDAEGEGPDGWCHHVQHVLPQGRCKWVNPNPKDEDAGGDEDEEEEEEEGSEVVPETGPSLLSAIMQDPPVDSFPAWTPKLTSQKNVRNSGVVMSSNRWPGAHALAYNKGLTFQNVYFGAGHMYSSQPYSPPLPPPAEAEFPIDDSVREATDPSVDEVEKFQAEQNKGDGDDEDGDGDGDDE
jgi:radial spoke head protein 4A